MSKPDPRIAPKEMIVTRFKSAQQRRQLREKDRSMTKVTQLLKSPPQKKTRKKAQRSPRKRKEEKNAVVEESEETEEYYPDKLKRVFGEKRVFLKHKANLTLVARTNKRKFNTPRKGIKSPPLPSSDPHWLSIEEAVRLVEDTESLTDEDLMEILTCPSPVWWEPSEHSEEPIYTRSPDETPLGTPTKASQVQEITRKDSKASTDSGLFADMESITETDSFTSDNIKISKNKDDRFINKRKKLENVLGNIKSKALTGKDCVKSEKMVGDEVTNELVDINNDKINNKGDNVVDATKKVDEQIKHAKVKKLSESTEEDLADLNFRDDEMLLDLENMDIPIEADAKSPSGESVIFVNDDECNKIYDVDDATDNFDEINTENKVEEGSSINEEVNKTDIKPEETEDFNISSHNKITKEDIPKLKIKNSETPVTENEILTREKLDLKLIEVPKNLPPLKKRPKFETPKVQSPVSFKSIDTTETSSISSHDISDTISDTNIKFITEEDIDSSEVDSKIDIKKERAIIDQVKDEKYSVFNKATDSKVGEKKSNQETITVYKITPNEKEKTIKFKCLPEYSNYVDNLKQIEVKTEINKDESTKGKINSFYKKCKNVNRKRCKKEDLESNTSENPVLESNTSENPICDSCEPKKSITVAQEENVRYCLKCSSIFDTDECSYCLKTKNAKNDNESTDNVKSPTDHSKKT